MTKRKIDILVGGSEVGVWSLECTLLQCLRHTLKQSGKFILCKFLLTFTFREIALFPFGSFHYSKPFIMVTVLTVTLAYLQKPSFSSAGFGGVSRLCCEVSGVQGRFGCS